MSGTNPARILARCRPDELRAAEAALDPEAVAAATDLVQRVRDGGLYALLAAAVQFGDLPDRDATWRYERAELEAALERVSPDVRSLLERCAARIRAFAEAQRAAIQPFERTVEGLRIGQDVSPVDRAGCYAPGGRYPLPSSVLMTAVTARAAGVRDVWVASPRPSDVTLAAACVAGADGVLGIGGAQIVAALAYGAGPIEASDVIVGPGNRYVTAAKYVVSRDVGIDMLAGPSELVVVADEGDDAGCIAADLIAQAEHDPDARTRLVTTSEDLADRVDAALQAQLADLPTADVARASLAAGAAVVCANAEEMVAVVDRLAPEHLEVLTADPAGLAARFRHYGAVFVGRGAAEVFGDYGVGPNHTLPTGGTARHRGGLSVLDFLRVRTWMQDAGAGPSPELVADTRDLAELEGLIGHARSATQRF